MIGLKYLLQKTRFKGLQTAGGNAVVAKQLFLNKIIQQRPYTIECYQGKDGIVLHVINKFPFIPDKKPRKVKDPIDEDKIEPFENETYLSQNNDDGQAKSVFLNVSMEPFPDSIQDKLSLPVDKIDVEVKPDGIIYIPEIKYRKRLNEAFGRGGWAMVPLGPHVIRAKRISREYALFCHGRFVSQARGEMEFFSDDGIPTATEGCKSNALMRCCKDLGICWELWDPRFIRAFKKEFALMVQGTHLRTGQLKWIWRKKDTTLEYPYRESKQ